MNSSDDLKCEKRKFEVKILSEVMNAIEVMNSIGVMYSNEVMNSRDELKCLKVKLQYCIVGVYFII